MRRAIIDLYSGVKYRWAWSLMATQDIRLRYRGSVLGPFWVTLTTAIMVASMGFVYGVIFKMDISVYLPYLAFGLIPWQFISSMVNESCQSMIAAQPIIHQATMPLSVHIFRMVYRNVLVMIHNLPIIVAVLFIFHVSWNWLTFMALPGFALLIIDSVAIGLLLGLLSARFRDVPPIVANIMQIIFFLTPILWTADALGSYRIIADFNPIFAIVDIVRAPLLGQYPANDSWPVACVSSMGLCVIAMMMFARFRRRIAYWI